LRCLIVDDSEEFLASATRLLKSQGIDVVATATRGREALELAVRLRPDIALVDIELAEEDGIALSYELRERAPATRIVLVSAYERDELAELIAGSPAAGFIPKQSLGAAALGGLLGAT